MKKLFFGIFVVFLVAGAGCRNKTVAPIDNYPSTSTNKTVTSTTSPTVEKSLSADELIKLTAVYKIDTQKSIFKWSGKSITGKTHTGTASLKPGQFERVLSEIQKSTTTTSTIDIVKLYGNVEVDMVSIQSDEKLDTLEKHLKSADFFDVEKYPVATLALRSIEKTSSDSDYKIIGDLKIKDRTEPINFQMKVVRLGEELQGNASFTIDRTVWGIKYGSDKFFKNLGDKIIKDEIEIQLQMVVREEKSKI